MAIRLLVSVRSVAEARLAAQGGADFIDLKEPSAGALGGLSLATIEAIVGSLRHARVDLPTSATIGDVPGPEVELILQRIQAVAACGVHYVKVGIERTSAAPALLHALAGSGVSVVPVFIADRGVDFSLVDTAAGLGFPALMLDTADKRAGSLFELAPEDTLRRFVTRVQGAGALAGLAGALRLEHAARLLALAPDFAGFRSAVCDGDRSGALSVQRLSVLRLVFDSERSAAGKTQSSPSPSSIARTRTSSAQ